METPSPICPCWFSHDSRKLQNEGVLSVAVRCTWVKSAARLLHRLSIWTERPLDLTCSRRWCLAYKIDLRRSKVPSGTCWLADADAEAGEEELLEEVEGDHAIVGAPCFSRVLGTLFCNLVGVQVSILAAADERPSDDAGDMELWLRMLMLLDIGDAGEPAVGLEPDVEARVPSA